MTLIEWKDEFSLGIAAVDHEHRELIELINALHTGIAEDPSKYDVLAALGEIHARISAHFALEERYMRESRYASFAEHKEDHEALLDEICDFMDAVDDDGQFDESGLADQLDRWFTTHFRTHDKALHRLWQGH